MEDKQCRGCSAMWDKFKKFENLSGCVDNSEKPFQNPRKVFEFHCSPNEENDSKSTRKSTTRNTFRRNSDNSKCATGYNLCSRHSSCSSIAADTCYQQIFEQSNNINHLVSSYVSRSCANSYVNNDLTGDMQNRDASFGVHADEKPLLKNDGFVDYEKTLSKSNSQLIQVGGKTLERSYSVEKSKQISHFVQQERSHTEVKCSCCNFCGKQFTRSAHLKRHTRIHTGEKPFNCSHCCKKFSDFFNVL